MAIRATETIIYNDGKRVRVITSDDGVVHLPVVVERRFVEQGAAIYVDKTAAKDPTKAPKQDAEESPAVEPDADEQIDGAVESDYGSMTQAELKAECDARGIAYSARATKAQLVEALEADDVPPELNALGAE